MEPTYHKFEEDELDVSGKGTDEEVVEEAPEEVYEPETVVEVKEEVAEPVVVKSKLVPGVVSCDLLNVRSGPGTDYPPIVQLGRGITLFVDLEKSTEDFYCVAVHEGYEADSYAMKQFVELV